MVTATLKDSTPTTTITFYGFKVVARRLEAVNFTPVSYPDDEGTEVIHLLQWVRVFTVTWQLINDATWPSSGDSAADKRADLESFIKSGGDSEGIFTLTFDSEDSTPASPQVESYNGRVKLLTIRSIAGDNTVVIEGELEFWEDNVS